MEEVGIGTLLESLFWTNVIVIPLARISAVGEQKISSSSIPECDRKFLKKQHALQSYFMLSTLFSVGPLMMFLDKGDLFSILGALLWTVFCILGWRRYFDYLGDYYLSRKEKSRHK